MGSRIKKPRVNTFYLRLTDEVRCRFYLLVTAILIGVLNVVANMNEHNEA